MSQFGIMVDGENVLSASVDYRAFQTGSLGYQLAGPVSINGRKFQGNLILTEVNSADRTDAEAVQLRAENVAKVAARAAAKRAKK